MVKRKVLCIQNDNKKILYQRYINNNKYRKIIILLMAFAVNFCALSVVEISHTVKEQRLKQSESWKVFRH